MSKFLDRQIFEIYLKIHRRNNKVILAVERISPIELWSNIQG